MTRLARRLSRRGRVPRRSFAGGTRASTRAPTGTGFRGWFASANKLVLGAIGAGVAGIITAAVLAIPHELAAWAHSAHPQEPVTILGGASPGLEPRGSAGGALQGVAPGTDPCDLAGEYVVPGAVQIHGSVTTSDVAALVSKAADASETDGSYLLQATPGQSAVLTGIHTVLLRRVPAISPATVVVVDSMCAGSELQQYDASIDLDASNLTPELTELNEASLTRTPVTNPATVIAQGQPLSLNFSATTAKFDVTWQLRFDYAVGGEQKTATLPSGSTSFQTDAISPDDSWLTLMLGSDGSTWSASAATATQERAQDQADAETTVAYDYKSLSNDLVSLQADSPPHSPYISGDALARTRQDEQWVLAEIGKADNSTVCGDAEDVSVDAQQVADAAEMWAYDDSAVSDALHLDSDLLAVTSDLETLLQVDPRFNGSATVPPPNQIRQKLNAARSAETEIASKVNPAIKSVDDEITTAYGYAAKAAAAGHSCEKPRPARTIAPVGAQ